MIPDLFAPDATPTLDVPSRFRWATITDTDPLRLRLDGDADGLPVTPDTLVDPKTLAIGRRVWVQFFGRRLVVLGAAPDPNPPVDDTGWVQVAINESNFLPYGAGLYPQIRRIGKQVFFTGSVKPTSTALSALDGAGNYSTNSICTLPAGFEPSSVFIDPPFVCQGSGDDRWSLRVYTSGNVIAHRYGPGTPGTSTWLPFNVSWTID